MNLQNLITNAGYTQTEIASILKIRQQTVSKWCNKKSTPALPMMKQLAEILNTQVQVIIDCFIDEKK